MSRDFNGTTDFIDFGDVLNISGTGLSICAWLWRKNVNDNIKVISRANGGVGQPYQWVLNWDNSPNNFAFYIGTGGALVQIFSGGPLTDTTGWHHVGVTYDGALVKFYKDSVQALSVAETRSIDSIAGAIVQHNKLLAAFSACRNAHLSVYNVGLSQAEIFEAMMYGSTQRGLRGYWKMDSSGPIEMDRSNKGNHGIVTGTSLFSDPLVISRPSVQPVLKAIIPPVLRRSQGIIMF